MFYGYGILNNHVPTLKATVMRVGAALSSLLTGLYAVYKGESNANDSLGAYNGTAVGGLTYGAGKSGNAFIGNGTNAYVSLPTDTFNSLTGDFSINAWVYFVNTGITQTIVSSLAYNGASAWGFNITNFGGNSIAIYNGTGTFYTLTEASPNPYNTWYMVTITRKASTGTKIYYNGSVSASNASSVNPVYNTTNHRPSIGASSYGPLFSNLVQYYLANGSKIDELNAWNKELTSTEVTTLYNSGAGKFYPTF